MTINITLKAALLAFGLATASSSGMFMVAATGTTALSSIFFSTNAEAACGKRCNKRMMRRVDRRQRRADRKEGRVWKRTIRRNDRTGRRLDRVNRNVPYNPTPRN